MAGLSLSLMKLDDTRLARLDAYAEPLDWPSAATPASDFASIQPPALPAGAQTTSVPTADETTPTVLSAKEQAALVRCLRAAAVAVAAMEPSLTEWDSKVGVYII